MNNQEAIYRLEALLTMCDFRDAFGDRVDSKLYEDAVAMAIEALSAKDINVPSNGDLISRQDAIDYCYQLINVEHQQGSDDMDYGQERVNQTEVILHHLEFMPSAEPEIIYCKDCKKHNREFGGFEDTGNGRHWYYKNETCPLIPYRGKAQGHEFDYQFCSCADSKATWEKLQEEAKSKLGEDIGVDKVQKHWRSIIDGAVPFGYEVEND